MANITLRRRPSRKDRVLKAAGKAGTAVRKAMKARIAWAAGRKVPSAAATAIKARIAWIAGKRATKVAVPAVAVGTAAVVAKRSGRFERSQDGQASTAEQPADSTPTSAVA